LWQALTVGCPAGGDCGVAAGVCGGGRGGGCGGGVKLFGVVAIFGAAPGRARGQGAAFEALNVTRACFGIAGEAGRGFATRGGLRFLTRGDHGAVIHCGHGEVEAR
jgi:hypothetical protein